MGDATIVPSPLATAEREAIALVQGLAPGVSVQLRIGEVIGEGGMGIIRAAEQIALGRSVAVKTLKPGTASPMAVRDLLREAWITGAVEHPSVVPVHYLELDRDGVPLVVLKRIEGTAWSALVHAPDQVQRRFGATDLVAWNLGVFLQLLNAVSFAHSRGILHRDLKPANVMIGDFGEVYLLDWGIAVSLTDDGSGRLPLAASATGIAGTPGYMAPEMLGRDGDVLSERTDVYLAGAVLFEIITGHPPHAGRDPVAIIASILTAVPEIPSSAPAELGRICARSLDPDPAKRFASIAELRLAVQGYVEHRGSSQLGERASADLVRLLDGVATAGREEIYRLFGACRFGFHEALAVWRDNAAAQAGLVAATVALAEYELARDNPDGALALLGDIDAGTEIVERARRASAAHAERKAELERLHRDLDLSVYRQPRMYISVVLGLIFTILPLVNARTIVRYQSHAQQIGFSSVFALVFLAVTWMTRRTLTSTAINRRSLLSIVIVFAAQAMFGVAAWFLELPLATVQILMILLWATVTALVAVHVDRRLAPSALSYLAAFLIAARWPEARPYVASGSNLVLTINVLLMWRRVPATR